MNITVDDRYPGASPGRKTYLEGRAHRVLARVSHRLREVAVEVGVDPHDSGRCQVRITARTSKGETATVSSRRRTLPDSLAEAFDALVTRLALSGIRAVPEDDVPRLGRPELHESRPSPL